MVEGEPHRQRRHRPRSRRRRRRSGAASKAAQTSFTPYQRFDFLSAWQRQVGEREGLAPFIVIAYDAERRPLLLLPLALRHAYGARCASFMGGKHSTFNMALCDRDFAASATQADLEGLISAISQRSEADVLALHQQPLRWRDLPNPLALLPHQPSVNDCPLLTMEPGAAPAALISNSFRRRLKGKERKLQSLPGYRYHVATSDADIARLLDWFFRVKPLRMAEQKLPNVFAEPGIEDFIRSACTTPLAGGGHAIDIHALECDEEVIAIFAGVADGHRFSMMFNTYTMSAQFEIQPRPDPDARHHRSLCRRRLSRARSRHRLGRLQAAVLQGRRADLRQLHSAQPARQVCRRRDVGLNRTKRLVKHNPALLEMAQKLRNAFS